MEVESELERLDILYDILKKDYGVTDIRVTLGDLVGNENIEEVAKEINEAIAFYMQGKTKPFKFNDSNRGIR